MTYQAHPAPVPINAATAMTKYTISGKLRVVGRLLDTNFSLFDKATACGQARNANRMFLYQLRFCEFLSYAVTA